MFKRSSIAALISALLLAAMLLALTGCGSGKTEDSAAAGGTDDYYTLSLTMHDPVTAAVGVLYQEWADEIYDLTDGHVKIELYGSATLAPGTEVVDYVQSGAADIGWIYTAFFSGQFPLTEVVSVPMSGLYHPAQTANVLWDLYEEYPALQEELSGFKVLMLYGNPVNFISTKDKPIESLSDLKGMNLRAPTGGVSEVLKAWGVNPILMATNDIYEALEKGTIAGTVHEWNGLNTFSLYEQLNYYMDMPLYEGAFVLGMNLDSWNKLPAEYQEAIESVSLREGSVKYAEGFNEAAMAAKDKILADGGTLVPLSDEALAEFRTAADAYADQWADSVTTDSFDGAAYYARMVELAEQYATY